MIPSTRPEYADQVRLVRLVGRSSTVARTEQLRQQLTGWMRANKTGDAKLWAGLPREWKVADKTGAGERGTTNDLGVFWPPGRKPLLLTVYLTASEPSAEARNAAIAKLAHAVADLVTARAS